MPGQMIYRCQVQPEWIDYNGHLRDAYYVVVLSTATDALMDRLGLDADYRERTRCTLYSLEMHMHWLSEVKRGDTLEVDAHLLDADKKRLQVGLDIRVVGRTAVAATGEFVLLHVRQGDPPGAASFPPEIERAIDAFRAAGGSEPWAGPGSRALKLGKR